MIAYNMCYRGPLEYDKMTLNTLQFHNEIVDFIKSNIEKDLYLSEETLNSIFDIVTGTKDKEGLSNTLYYKLLNYKEC